MVSKTDAEEILASAVTSAKALTDCAWELLALHVICYPNHGFGQIINPNQRFGQFRIDSAQDDSPTDWLYRTGYESLLTTYD